MTHIDIKLIKYVFWEKNNYKTGFILIPPFFKVLIKIEYNLSLWENGNKMS